MSVSIFGVTELSDIASSFYKGFSEYIDSYKDRQIAKQESLNEHETRDDLNIRLDNYRWFWERVSLANQLESAKRYTKYGESESITHHKINVLNQSMPIPKSELYTKLRLVRYNSDTFLNKEDSEKLDGYIEMVGDQVIREGKN